MSWDYGPYLISGIYQIRNKVNGKIYIGSAKSILKRAKQHLYMLVRGRHHNRYLQYAFWKYGIDSFEFSPLLICKEGDLLFFEQRFMDGLMPEYNLCKVAGSAAGRVLSEEHKQKIRESVKASWVGDDERKARQIQRNREYSPSQEVREKISRSSTGRKHSYETRRKIAAISTGRKHTAESRAKMSQAKRKATNTLIT